MPKRIDITGERFGRWTATKYVGDKFWRCQCDCGTVRLVLGRALRDGTSKSCGCYQADRVRQLRWVHGYGFDDPTYRSWQAMRNRCHYRKASNYKYYGKRGITICKRWCGKYGFKNFLADMGPRPSGRTLDRFPDNDGNYKPANCRWATQSDQVRRRRKLEGPSLG